MEFCVIQSLRILSPATALQISKKTKTFIVPLQDKQKCQIFIMHDFRADEN